MKRYKKSFFEGDFEVTDNNIYTKLHEYRKEKKSIILATVNHYGSEKYFKGVEKALDNCDSVLYESTGLYEEESTEKPPLNLEPYEKGDSLDKVINKYPEFKKRYSHVKNHGSLIPYCVLCNHFEAFSLASYHYYQIIVEKNMIEEQSQCISVKKPNWEVCDVTSDESERIMLEFCNLLRQMGEKKLVNATLTILEGIILVEKNQWNPKHMIKVIKNGYGDILESSEIIKPLATREAGVMREKLKEKLQDQGVKSVGIIYGAGHGPGIRKLIESLNFKKIKTKSLKSL